MIVATKMMPEYQRPFEEVLVALGSDARRGLSAARSARTPRPVRRERAGRRTARAWLAKVPRAVPGRARHPAARRDAISAGLWLYERDSALPYEAIAIFAVVLLNAVMGYVQESRAESAVAALRQMSAAHAHVIRDGEPRDAFRRPSSCPATSSSSRKATRFPPTRG